MGFWWKEIGLLVGVFDGWIGKFVWGGNGEMVDEES